MRIGALEDAPRGTLTPPLSRLVRSAMFLEHCVLSRSPWRYAPDNNLRCQERERKRKREGEKEVKRAPVADAALWTMSDRRTMDRLLIPHSRGPFFANVGSLAGVDQMERETIACPVCHESLRPVDPPPFAVHLSQLCSGMRVALSRKNAIVGTERACSEERCFETTVPNTCLKYFIL